MEPTPIDKKPTADERHAAYLCGRKWYADADMRAEVQARGGRYCAADRLYNSEPVLVKMFVAGYSDAETKDLSAKAVDTIRQFGQTFKSMGDAADSLTKAAQSVSEASAAVKPAAFNLRIIGAAAWASLLRMLLGR